MASVVQGKLLSFHKLKHANAADVFCGSSFRMFSLGVEVPNGTWVLQNRRAEDRNTVRARGPTLGALIPPTTTTSLSLPLSLALSLSPCACVRESSAHRRPALRSADTPRGESALRVRVSGLYVDTKRGGARRSMGTLSRQLPTFHMNTGKISAPGNLILDSVFHICRT